MSKLTNLLTCFASELDRLETDAYVLLKEAFAKSVTLLIDEWEDFFGITHTTDAIETRRARLLAKMRATGGQSVDYFYSLAEALGYNIYPSTTNPHIQMRPPTDVAFIAGIAKANDIVGGSDAGTVYTSIITGTSVEADTFLQELFDKYKPAHAEFIYLDS
jgi:uncharacterized protein YmfQ (DUF2313 family)